MGKCKSALMNWQELFDSGVALEYTNNYKEWHDVTERPEVGIHSWYREKEIPKYQSDDNYLPK